MNRSCFGDECNWTVVAMPAMMLASLALSLYLVISGAENMYNFPLWPATVLSLISCASNCTGLCTQRFMVDISWIADNTTFQKNNVTGGWKDNDNHFCQNLKTGTQFQVITPRTSPQTVIAVVPKSYEYDGGGFYTGVILLSVVIMSLCGGLVVGLVDCWTERRKRNNYTSF